MTSEELRKMGFSQRVIAEWEMMEDRILDLEQELEDLKIEYEETKRKYDELQDEFYDRLIEVRRQRDWEESTKYW